MSTLEKQALFSAAQRLTMEGVDNGDAAKVSTGCELMRLALHVERRATEDNKLAELWPTILKVAGDVERIAQLSKERAELQAQKKDQDTTAIARQIVKQSINAQVARQLCNQAALLRGAAELGQAPDGAMTRMGIHAPGPMTDAEKQAIFQRADQLQARAEALLAELPDPAAAFDPSHGHGALYA